MGRRIQLDYAYMDKVMTNPSAEANAPGRILRCKPKSVKPPGGHTLWLGDLSIDASEQDVIDLFEPCGKIEMICLKVNQLRNGHFGHVKFFETEAVDKAAELAGSLLKGVPIRMDFAEDKPLAAYRAGKDSGPPETKRPDDCRTIWVGGLPTDVTEESIGDLLVKWEKSARFDLMRVSVAVHSSVMWNTWTRALLTERCASLARGWAAQRSASISPRIGKMTPAR